MLERQVLTTDLFICWKHDVVYAVKPLQKNAVHLTTARSLQIRRSLEPKALSLPISTSAGISSSQIRP